MDWLRLSKIRWKFGRRKEYRNDTEIKFTWSSEIM